MGKRKKNIEEKNFVPDSTSWMLGRQDDDLFIDEMEILDKVGNRTYMIVVIYDIVDNKKRTLMSKTLLGYGERVQRSAFECHLTLRKYEELLSEILPIIDEELDLLRVYKLAGNTETKIWGRVPETEDEDVIIL
jgi:CRISPR-associated protein Cas2